MRQDRRIFTSQKITKKIQRLFFSSVFILIFGMSSVLGAGYTCPTTKNYTSCSANYYRVKNTSNSYYTCTACPSNSTSSANNTATGCTCKTGYSVGGTVGGATTGVTSACSPILTYVTLDQTGATTTGTLILYAKYGATSLYSNTARTTTISKITVPQKKYTVTYNANGGSVSTTSATSNCPFAGYGTYVNADGTITTAGINAANSHYTQEAYSWGISWGTCGALTLPTPTRTGYTFNGWYTAASGGTKVGAAGASYTPSANTTLYAQWTANCNKITLNNTTNGGSGGTTVLYKKSGSTTWYSDSSCSTAVTSITKPTKTNATYGGHYNTSAASGGTQIITAAGALSTTWTVTGATTLYAQYDCNTGYVKSGTRISGACAANTYTVTYNANGGSGTTASSSHTYDVSKALTTNGFTNGTKKFLGWSTSNSATSATYTNGQSVSNLTTTNGGTVPLYAVWGTCTACSAGTGATCSLSAPLGVCTYATACKTGYNTIVNNGKYNPSCSANKYTVSFNINGGSGSTPSSVTATYDSAMPSYGTLETTPYKTGYTFMGWYDNATYTSGTKYYNADGTSARTWNKTSNATLYAGWQANTITVVYNGNGQTSGSIANQTCYYDQDCIVRGQGNLLKTDYILVGWNGGGLGTKRGGDNIKNIVSGGTVTLRAEWRWEYTKVTLNDNGGSGGSGTIYLKYDGENWSMSLTNSNKEAISSVAIPTRKGYTFAGYEIDECEHLDSAFDCLNRGGKYDENGVLVAWQTLIGADGKLVNPDSTLGYSFDMPERAARAKWTVNSYTCAPGKYLNGTTCSTCEAGYACPGGTWTYNGSVQGRSLCSGTAYSGSGQASCTSCPNSATGYYSWDGDTLHDSVYECYKNVTYTATYGSGTQNCYYTSGSGTSAVYAGNSNAGCDSKKITSCNAGYWLESSSNTDCTAVGKGYWSGAGSTTRTECANKPSNSDYTSATTNTSSSCPWVCNAGYNGSSANGNTSCSTCASGSYCSGGTQYSCPNPTTYAPNSFPDDYYSPSIESVSITSGTGLHAITQCQALYWYTSSRGKFYEYSMYSSSAGRYTAAGNNYWGAVNAGYYLTDKAGCGSYAYYSTVKSCPANSYCPGKEYTTCNSSNQATVHTTNFGLYDCPSGYPNSAADATAITSCYSGTKSRPWSGGQNACSKPSNCATVACNTCSIAACDYVAYSNSAGTGDGTVKSGCSSNSANCNQTVKSVTASANAFVDGTSCKTCSSFSSTYTKSDGGNIGSGYCYKDATKTGSQLACSQPSNSVSYTCGTCSPGTCIYKDYYSATDTTCTPSNCTKPVASATCKANYYGTTSCTACEPSYPYSDQGTTSDAYCYASKTNTGSQIACSKPANSYSHTCNSCTPGTCSWRDYKSATDTTCTPTNCTQTATVNTCAASYYKNGNACSLCSGLANGLYPNSDNGNSSGTSACRTNSLSGKVIATANATITTDCATKYYKTAHTVNYGSTSSCETCPATASGSDSGRDAKTDCYVSCSAKTISNGTTTVVNAKEYHNGSAYPACTYNVNCNAKYGASGNKTSNPACTVCATGKYSAGGTATCSACSNAPSNSSYIGNSASNTCPWECNDGYNLTADNQCGQFCTSGITHIKLGNGLTIPLYSSARTSPAINVKVNNAVCYGSLATGQSSGALNVKVGSTTYHAVQ